MIEMIFIGAVLVIVLVGFVIEWRISSRPASELSEREKRYMRASRQVTIGVHRYTTKVAPPVAIVGSALLLIVGIVALISGDQRAGVVGVIAGAVIGCGMVAFLA